MYSRQREKFTLLELIKKVVENYSFIISSFKFVHLHNGFLFVFEGQLGLNLSDTHLVQQNQDTAANSSSSSPSSRDGDRLQPWHSFPNAVPNIGTQWGRKATWVGASGDQTYVKVC